MDNRSVNLAAAIPLLHRALEVLGFPVNEDGMKGTPKRVAKAWLEMSAGMDASPEPFLNVTFEEGAYDQAVALAGIPFVSLCEHHMLPFSGTAGVAYIPDGRVVGLSKLARTVDVFARRPQLQERLTQQVAEAVSKHLKPKGVAVVIEAQHSCMTCRGAMKPGAVMRTSAMRGAFMDDAASRAEVMRLLNGG